MHKYYKDNLDEISPNLKLFKDRKTGKDGYEYYIPTIGEIDLLCLDENNFVVIEFKKNKGSDKVIGQTLRYIGWIKKNMCQNNQKVRGIIICRKYEAKIKYAADAVGPAILQYLETKFDTKLSPAKISSSN
jgi:RecB family endonuclease NucS